MELKRVVLIINPASGGARRADLAKFEGIVTGHGASLDVLRTERPAHATELARQASRDAVDLVIAAGGDGTVNETLNGLVNTQTPLGIIPLGTANVLAREVALPLEPEAALVAALERSANPMALGHIDVSGLSRYFCLMAGAGFDSHVVHNVSTRVKKLMGKGAYVLQALQTLLGWESAEIQLNIDGTKHSCMTAVLCNARMYGGSFIMAPDADISRADFEVIMLKSSGRLNMLVFALAFLTGRHTGLASVQCIRGRDISINGTSSIQLDGDDFAPGPAKITITPEALRLVY